MGGVRVGTSWRGRRPGTRHWVSMPLSVLVLGWAVELAVWLVIGLPVLGLWLTAQCLVLMASAIGMIAHLMSGKPWTGTGWHRGRFSLWYWE